MIQSRKSIISIGVHSELRDWDASLVLPCALLPRLKISIQCMEAIMVTVGNESYRTILTTLLASLTTASLLGQEPLIVQPLEPLRKDTNKFIQPLTPPASAGPSVPNIITLEPIPQASSAPNSPSKSLNTNPVNVLPLAPAKNAPPTRKGKLDVDQMIRTPTNHELLFSKLNTDNSFYSESQLSMPVRGQGDPTGALNWSPSGYCWQSPAFCYSPLYFEQPNLERYGNSPGHYLAPAASATSFFAHAVILPAKALWQPPWSKQCTLGTKRPGDCAPLQRHRTTPPQSSSRAYEFSEPTLVGPVSETNAATPIPNDAAIESQVATRDSSVKR